MIKRAGITRIDLIVAVACVVFVLANVPAIIAGGRGRAKLEVCMANLRALTAGWQMYADDDKGKIPVGDVWYSWSFPGTPGTSLAPQLAWHEWPHPWPHSMPPTQGTNQTYFTNPTEADWQHATAEGTLWKYIKDYKIYRCPVSAKDQYVTYAMAHSMNTYPNTGGAQAAGLEIRLREQIKRAAERIVFLDAGFAKRGAFYVKYTGGNVARWYDLPPVLHDQGTTFSFADGHVIYRKWTDPHTLQAAESGIWGGGPDDNCDCDLRWFSKATWGKLSSEWQPCTGKDCVD
jgi:prepilin-type processing-associated H-X9-DG protein